MTQHEWQPIETAPKNGTLLLLGTDKGVVFIGKYNKHLHIWVDDMGRERFRYVTWWAEYPYTPKKEAPAGEDRGQGGETKETTTKNEPSV